MPFLHWIFLRLSETKGSVPYRGIRPFSLSCRISVAALAVTFPYYPSRICWVYSVPLLSFLMLIICSSSFFIFVSCAKGLSISLIFSGLGVWLHRFSVFRSRSQWFELSLIRPRLLLMVGLCDFSFSSCLTCELRWLTWGFCFSKTSI